MKKLIFVLATILLLYHINCGPFKSKKSPFISTNNTHIEAITIWEVYSCKKVDNLINGMDLYLIEAYEKNSWSFKRKFYSTIPLIEGTVFAKKEELLWDQTN